MGCNCGKKKRMRGVCDVHALVDNDTQERLVKWCEICGAWICDNCRGNLVRRAQAAAIRAARLITQ